MKDEFSNDERAPEGEPEEPGQASEEQGSASEDVSEVTVQAGEDDFAAVEVQTGPAWKPGDVVEHRADRRLKGRVLKLREAEGRHSLLLEGVGNWVPAEEFVRVEEGAEPVEGPDEAEPRESFDLRPGERVRSQRDPAVRGLVRQVRRAPAGGVEVQVSGFGNWFPARDMRRE